MVNYVFNQNPLPLCTILTVFIVYASSESLRKEDPSNLTCSCPQGEARSWKDSATYCQLSASSLASFRQHGDPFNKSCPHISETYWSDRYTVESPWIELTGCFQEEHVQIAKTATINITLCFAVCKSYPFFGLQQRNKCLCLFNGSTQLSTHAQPNECVTSSNDFYISGKVGFIAVYQQVSANVISDGTLAGMQTICAAINCETTGNTRKGVYRSRKCSEPLWPLCTNDLPPSITGHSVEWKIASETCYNHSSFLSRTSTFRSDNFCQTSSNSVAWVYIIKQEVEIKHSLPDIHMDLQLKKCEYVTFLNKVTFAFGSCSAVRKFSCCKNLEVNDNYTSIPGIRQTTNSISSTVTNEQITSTLTSSTEELSSNLPYDSSTIVTSQNDYKSTLNDNGERKSSTQSTTISTNDSNRRTNHVVYIAVGCGIFALVIVALVIILFCRQRRNKARSCDSENNNLKLKVSSGMRKVTDNSTVAIQENGYNKIEHRYEMIEVDEGREVKRVQENIDPNQEKIKPPNSNNYTDPWSDLLGNKNGKITKTDNELKFENHQNQYSLAANPKLQNHSLKKKDDDKYRKDDYDIIGTKKDTKHNFSDNEITYDKGQIEQKPDANQYDHFEKNEDNQTKPSSNYDHFPAGRKITNKQENTGNDDDLEDYDHLQTSPNRPESVDSTYDHTHAVKYEDTYNHFNQRNPNANPDTYDHLPNEDDDSDGDYATADNQDDDNNVSGDYEISDELPAVRVNSGNRDSYYTSVVLPEMDA